MANGISRANARTYIARIVGGAASPQILDMADEAILAGAQDWTNARKWNFLLKDTALGFSVAACTGNSATITAPSSGAFDAVNVGVTVTVSGNSAALAVGTTVSSYTRSADGTVATITLSNAVTSSTGVYTMTFSGDIPLIAGTQEYNAPTDFDSPYIARLLTNKWALVYVPYHEWQRKVNDQTVRGTVEGYTIYNPVSFGTQNYMQKRLRVFMIPSASDTLHLQYFRNINASSDPVDMFQNYLYPFLDYCQWLLLLKKSAHDDRLPQIEERARGALTAAMVDDEEISEDWDVTMKSQMEMGFMGRPLWGNGQFYPDYGA